MSFGTMILVTIALYCGTGKPVEVMRFAYPHSLEMETRQPNPVDAMILKSIESGEMFSFCNCAAKVVRIRHMVTPSQIGDEIPLPSPSPRRED